MCVAQSGGKWISKILKCALKWWNLWIIFYLRCLHIDDDFIEFPRSLSVIGKQSKRGNLISWKLKLFFLLMNVAMMNYHRRRHFAVIEASKFPREIWSGKVTKNKLLVNIARSDCVEPLWLRRRNALLLSIPRVIEKRNYLYLFIIRDADVIKYLCLSFSRLCLILLSSPFRFISSQQLFPSFVWLDYKLEPRFVSLW